MTNDLSDSAAPDQGRASDVTGPPDGRQVPRFAGPDTFARLPRLQDTGRAAVAIAGIPFDSGVSYRPGARFGPTAVRNGSKLLRPYHPGLETSPLALVHFDAHLDTWDTYFGAPYTHGTPFRRAVEEGLLALDSSAHVGIRGPLYDAADLTDDKALGFATVSTADVARGGVDQAIDRIRDRVGDRPVYLSVDIDVLDPAHAPGTGTPEPGGLTTRELQLILRGLAGLNLTGADIVEVAPAYDHAELTALAAANVGYEILGLFARQAAT